MTFTGGSIFFVKRKPVKMIKTKIIRNPRTRAVISATRNIMVDEVLHTALDIHNKAKELIHSGPPSGRWYKRKTGTGRGGQLTGPDGKKTKGYKWHRASASGQPPMTDTGFLANSIRFPQITKGGLEATVVVAAPYAKHLEFGTSKMHPRPFLKPATNEAHKEFRARRPSILKRIGRTG